MTIARKVFTGVLSLLVLSGVASGQCYNGSTTYVTTVNYVIRENGNSVYAYAESSISGTDAPYWQLYVSSWLYRDTTLLANYSRDTKTPAGTTTTRWYRRTLQDTSNGPGSYHMDAFHEAYNAPCNRWAPPYWNSFDGNTHSQQVVVTRPTRPDYASFAGNTHYVMFLGNGIPYNGQYSAQTVLVAGNSNGAPETPTWIFKAGSTFGTLTCTICTQPQFRASRRGSGCNAYDVVLATTYNGFESDPFWMSINGPHNTIAATDPATGEYWKTTDQPYSTNGWQTRYNYKTQGLCATDAPLSQYDMNEQFGSWNDDYYLATGTHNSWSPPDCALYSDSQHCGFTVYGDQWQDSMSFACPANNCTPLPMYPGPDYTKVQSAPQTWRVGTGVPGSGMAIQINTHQRYKDQGGHENIVNPAIQ